MCDTQVLLDGDAVWFAKNSDREPSEPQPVVRFAAVRGDVAMRVRTTYLEIPQVPDRCAVILSKPAWCWGAEMGVNDAGVAIGNEAIFSRSATLTPALLGMDLVRLGLERASTAAQALTVMTALLETHGQGGPAGYQDRGFCYDNSFLIADAREAWVLETAGRQWAARRVSRHCAISNQLTLHRDHERRSVDVAADADFARRFDTRLMPWFAGARTRRALGESGLQAVERGSFTHLAAQLRRHRHDGGDPARGSNRDVCMHAAGFVRRHQTTGSMIVRLTAQGPTVWFTGTSAPCLSIFRPVAFDDADYSVLTPATRQIDAPLWRRHEWLHRRALGDAALRERLRATREEVERQSFSLLSGSEPDAVALQRADRLAAAWHKVLWESAARLPAPRLSRYWRGVAARDGIDPARAAPSATTERSADVTL